MASSADRAMEAVAVDGEEAPETIADSVTGGPHDVVCGRCCQLVRHVLQDGLCQMCTSLDLASLPIQRSHAGALLKPGGISQAGV